MHLCDRKRPRSTYINKRFLSRTVASAARTVLPHRRSAVPTAYSTSREEVRESSSRSEHSSIPQHQSGTTAVKIANKRKHFTDSRQLNSNCCSDRDQSVVYDVHDYVKINKRYKLQRKSDSETTALPSSQVNSTSCSSRRTK